MSSTSELRGTPPPPASAMEKATVFARRLHWPRLGPRGSAPRRIALAMTDQCLASASNFLVGMVIARIDGPAGLGAYAVAYSLWLLLAAIHRAIVTDPMSIENDVLRPDANERVRAGMAAEISMGAIVAVLMALTSFVLMALGKQQLGTVFLALAPFMPFLLVQDYWRWAGFMHARPGKSLANDIVFNTVQLVVLAALIGAGQTHITVAIIAWGLGAVAGAVYGLRQFSVRVHTRGGYRMVASRWHVSRWLLATGISGWAGSQAYPFLAGPLVGADGLGGLKAAQSLVAGPSLVLLQAGGSVGLPEASHSLERDGVGRLKRVAAMVTIATTASVGIVAAFVLVAAPQLLKLVYGPEFVPYATTAKIIAIAWVINSLAGGAVLILKVTRNTRALFKISLTNMFVLIAGTVGLSAWLGVNGTAYAMLITWTVSFFWCRRARAIALRDYEESPLPASEPTPATGPGEAVS
jgi:O-antigen/teichoic acid export membrane protein